MPSFRLRAWREQTLYDCEDYLVTPDDIGAATDRLYEAIERASFLDATVAPGIVSVDTGDEAVRQLDPHEVIASSSGIIEIDADGHPVRDQLGDEAKPDLQQSIRDAAAAGRITQEDLLQIAHDCFGGPTAEELEAATAAHCNDQCEIDGRALASRSESGTWVSAWLWVAAPAPPLAAIGDGFVNTVEQIDCDENDQERVAPAGTRWTVERLGHDAGDSIAHLVATNGCWVIVDRDQLASQFAKATVAAEAGGA